jgi:hypothetical protein
MGFGSKSMNSDWRFTSGRRALHRAAKSVDRRAACYQDSRVDTDIHDFSLRSGN